MDITSNSVNALVVGTLAPPPSPQVDDSHTVKELINTVAEKIGERHDMFTNACMQMYVCTVAALLRQSPLSPVCYMT